MDKLIEALQIFLKYGNLEYPTICEYQTLIICGINPDNVSEEDKKHLEELGFFIQDIIDGPVFYSYKYGSDCYRKLEDKYE